MMKSNLLKSERVKLGITQKKVCEKLKIDVSTYSKKENGVIEFKASEIRALKNILKLTPEKIDDIFFDTNVALKATWE